MSSSFGIAMNSATKTAIRKLKDSNNQYLWQPGLTGRDPDTILGVPVIVIPEMASMAANAKSIVAGDFSRFTIRELPIRLVRMAERYADYDQVGFVALTSMDSHVIDAGTNPIQHLIMAAS
jgi:HK97 family phage major capsid protein